MNLWQVFRQRSSIQTAGRRSRRAIVGLEILEERTVPTTFYVANGGSDANSGLAPSAPLANIQAALNASLTMATSGNTILVAAGTYTYVDALASASKVYGAPAVVGVVGQQVTIQGGFNSLFSSTSGTSVIDGGGQVRGVLVAAGAAPTAVNFSGFTIQNCLGRAAPGLGDTISAYGGGMTIFSTPGSTPPTDTISSVVFQNNTAQGSNVTAGSGGTGNGGGLCSLYSTVVLNNVSFSSNVARGGTGVTRGGITNGGGLFAFSSNVSGSGLTFTNNQALSANGGSSTQNAPDAFGGAFACQTSTAISFTNFTATGNLAQGGNGTVAGTAVGGAIYAEDASVSLTNATLAGNTANAGTPGAAASTGGAIAIFQGLESNNSLTLNQVSILNNTLGANSAGLGGGVASFETIAAPLNLNIVNSVIAGNTVQTGGGGGGAIWIKNTTASVSQSTIADNVVPNTPGTLGASILVDNATLNLAFSIVANDAATGLASLATHPTSPGNVNFTGVNLFANNAAIGPFTGPATNLLTAPDAGFTNSAARDYTLVSTSPAINAAVGSTQTVDRRGFPRVGVPDLGAFEFGATPPGPAGANFDELGAYRPSNGSWSLDSNGQFGFQTGGPAGAAPLSDRVLPSLTAPGPSIIPVAGDWTGTGRSSIGIFNNGTWLLDLNNTGVLNAGETFNFGQAGDTPVPGDYFTKGQLCLTVFRPLANGAGEFLISDQNWLAEGQAGQTIGIAETFIFGAAGDRVVVGDWTGNGITKVGVFRDASSLGAPGAAVFSLDVANHHAFDSSTKVFIFGAITDGVVIGDWNGSGTDKVGVYRDAGSYNGQAGNAVFSLDFSGQFAFTPGQSQVFIFGLASDKYVTGRWAYTTSTGAATLPSAATADGDWLSALLSVPGQQPATARDAYFAASRA